MKNCTRRALALALMCLAIAVPAVAAKRRVNTHTRGKQTAVGIVLCSRARAHCRPSSRPCAAWSCPCSLSPSPPGLTGSGNAAEEARLRAQHVLRARWRKPPQLQLQVHLRVVLRGNLRPGPGAPRTSRFLAPPLLIPCIVNPRPIWTWLTRSSAAACETQDAVARVVTVWSPPCTLTLALVSQLEEGEIDTERGRLFGFCYRRFYRQQMEERKERVRQEAAEQRARQAGTMRS
jgi:hypothetical protein